MLSQRDRAIAVEWPALAQAWGFRLEPRRGLMWGNVGGRETHASVVVREGHVMTYVQVMTSLPAGSHLSLTHQKSSFWSKLFRGQDMNVGDPEFDAAFVIKGEPKELVHATLTPSAREQIKGLLHAGASISLQSGWLAVWENQLVTDREHLNVLMKASCAAADALCHPNAFASGNR
jgi:hypothetical protein